MDIHTLDLGFRNLPGAAAAFLVIGGDEHLLVECGPAACHERLQEALQRHGSSPERIAHLFLTHIHLDHAGASGLLARHGAAVHVHPRGARHLVDPERLNASASRVFGDALERELGRMVACPPDRVHATEPGAIVPTGAGSFTALETPGHAGHHHAWVIQDPSGERHLFSGDAAGMRLPGTRFPTFPMVPPEFDLGLWTQSIQAMIDAGPTSLWMTHFDRLTDPVEHLHRVREDLVEETRQVCALLEEDESTALDRYRRWHHEHAVSRGVDARLLERHCTETHYATNLTGVARWLRQGGTVR